MDLSDQRTQIILVIVLAVAGAIYAWFTYLYSPKNEEIATLNEEIEQFELDIARFQITANQAEEVAAQLAAARQQWADILVQFPTTEKEDELLGNMSVAEGASRLYPISFERGDRRTQELYFEQDYVVRLLGEYQQVGRYIATLASLPRRISVARMQITHPSVLQDIAGGEVAGPPPTAEEVIITLTVTSYVVRVR